ncbi:MAG: alpha/beta fold hydrolase [Rhodothermales bacterium]
MLSYKTFPNPDSDAWVVFIHGAGGSSAVWFKQLRDFRERFNILLVDLRGHGKSSEYHGNEKRYTLASISQDVIEVLDTEGIGSAHFVGVSLGTILIRQIVEMAPKRVDSVIYAGAVAGFTWSARSLISVGQALRFLIPFRTLYATFAWIIMPGRKAAESRRVFRREARRVEPDEFHRWIQLVPEVRRRLKQWSNSVSDCRALYLMGGKDYLFLPPARRLATSSRNAFLQVIEGVGHVCNIERPAVFNEMAIAFLNGQQPDLQVSHQ